MAAPSSDGAVHSILIPPVLVSMEVTGAGETFAGTLAAMVVKIEENDPHPYAFLALT